MQAKPQYQANRNKTGSQVGRGQKNLGGGQTNKLSICRDFKGIKFFRS